MHVPVFQELCSALSNATTSNKSNKQTSPIKDGFKWIVENVLEDWETLDERVAQDMEVQKQKAFEEHKAKAERIRKMREERYGGFFVISFHCFAGAFCRF